jgi:heat shock protein HslJ
VTIPKLNYSGPVPATNPPLYTIEFKSDGTFAAKADCNQIAGTYTTDPSGGLTLTIGPSTIVACGPESRGDLYVFALSESKSYVATTTGLTITLADGGTLVYTTAVPPK